MPKDYKINTFKDHKSAWEHIKQLYEHKKRQVVILDTAQEKAIDLANKVKGFPIEGAKVPLILAVGQKPSDDIENALDIADAFVQLPLNKPLFQKTFDTVISTI
jgi:response regulator RpfG family c-di-GMP phosphodiesterase